MDTIHDSSLSDKLNALAIRAADAALDPDADPKLLPQLIGVAARSAIAAQRAAAAPAPDHVDEWNPDPLTGHPEMPSLMPRIPGPPWDPWRGMTDEDKRRHSDQMMARAIIWHQERADELLHLLVHHEVLDQQRADLRDIRRQGSDDAR